MAALAIPPPPPVAQGGPAPAAQTSGIINRLNQSRTPGQEQKPGEEDYSKLGLNEMKKEVGRLGDSVLKIARMSEVAMPSLMQHVAKMVEIGKAMEKDVDEEIQKMQQQMGAQTPPPQGAPSPTDAMPAAA